jgi:hypothetical protein
MSTRRHRQRLDARSRWSQRLKAGRPFGLRAESLDEAAALVAALDSAGIDILPSHWTSEENVITVRTRDAERALDVLEEVRQSFA